MWANKKEIHFERTAVLFKVLAINATKVLVLLLMLPMSLEPLGNMNGEGRWMCLELFGDKLLLGEGEH